MLTALPACPGARPDYEAIIHLPSAGVKLVLFDWYLRSAGAGEPPDSQGGER